MISKHWTELPRDGVVVGVPWFDGNGALTGEYRCVGAFPSMVEAAIWIEEQNFADHMRPQLRFWELLTPEALR